MAGTVTAFGAGDSSPRKIAPEKTERMAITTTAGLTKVRYRSELRRARERNEKISDCRLEISDLEKAARRAGQNRIENRQSKFDKGGGVAAERACSSVG